MSDKIPAPLFGIDEHVIVKHSREGTWKGYVLWRNYTGDAWEYEVSCAPHWQPAGPGNRWWPLAWESEMERVQK